MEQAYILSYFMSELPLLIAPDHWGPSKCHDWNCHFCLGPDFPPSVPAHRHTHTYMYRTHIFTWSLPSCLCLHTNMTWPHPLLLRSYSHRHICPSPAFPLFGFALLPQATPLHRCSDSSPSISTLFTQMPSLPHHQCLGNKLLVTFNLQPQSVCCSLFLFDSSLYSGS